METLRIAYADFWPEWSEENFIEPILKKHFDVKIDYEKPDVLFHSVFGGKTETPRYKCKKILFLGENYRAKSEGSDFSISFDPHDETNFRLPLWQVFILRKPEYLDDLLNKVRHDSFERFCSFTVSNPGNFMRNSVFKLLSNYKMVNSYGRYMTNSSELQKLSEGEYWRDAKIKFFRDHPHKFMITYENTPYRYYCTEKLMDSFLVGSVPIYWGDPRVAEDWNIDAFINGTKLGSGVVDAVRHVDQNKSEFEKIYNSPVFNDVQKDKLINNLGEFEHWLIKNIKK